MDEQGSGSGRDPPDVPAEEERGFFEGVAEGFVTTLANPIKILRAIIGGLKE